MGWLSSWGAVVFLISIVGISWVLSNPLEKNEAPAELVERQLTFTGRALSPAISPDGQLMAYLEGITDTTGRIVIQEISGGEPVEVIASTPYYQSNTKRARIEWSPDGKYLAVQPEIKWASRYQGRHAYQDLLIYSRLGQYLKTVPISSSADFAWSPDATEIASVLGDTLYLVNIQTLEMEKVNTSLDGLGQTRVAWLSYVAWSPSGKHLLARSSNSSGYMWWTIERNGKGTLLYETEDRLHEPVWSADGSRIYFLRINANDGYGIEFCRLSVSPQTGQATGPLEILHSVPEDVDDFSISADNKRLLYMREPNTSNIVRYDLKGGRRGAVLPNTPLTASTSTKMVPAVSPMDLRLPF